MGGYNKKIEISSNVGGRDKNKKKWNRRYEYHRDLLCIKCVFSKQRTGIIKKVNCERNNKRADLKKKRLKLGIHHQDPEKILRFFVNLDLKIYSSHETHHNDWPWNCFLMEFSHLIPQHTPAVAIDKLSNLKDLMQSACYLKI